MDEVQSIVLEKRQPLKIRFVERPELVYAIEEIAHAYFSFPTTSLVEQASDRSGYAVSPNPVEDVLSIYAPAHASGVLSLELFSTAGMLVYAESFGSARSQARVNVSDLKPGLYLCFQSQGDAGRDLLDVEFIAATRRSEFLFLVRSCLR